MRKLLVSGLLLTLPLALVGCGQPEVRDEVRTPEPTPVRTLPHITGAPTLKPTPTQTPPRPEQSAPTN